MFIRQEARHVRNKECEEEIREHPAALAAATLPQPA
jgi:hypothetical protein